jgi:hypothetical protein
VAVGLSSEDASADALAPQPAISNAHSVNEIQDAPRVFIRSRVWKGFPEM